MDGGGAGSKAAAEAAPETPDSRAAPLEAAERAATRRAQEALLQALVETGAKDQLLAQLRERLYDAGWLERVKEHIKGVLQHKGVDRVTLDEIVAEALPQARALVPDEVKAEALQEIRRFLHEPEA